MFRRFGYLTLPIRLLIIAIAAVVILVIGATVALAIANRTVVVAATESAVRAANRVCRCEVSVAGARYRLFRGLELSEPEIRLKSFDAVVQARTVRIRIGLRGLLRARSLLSGGLDARTGNLWETLGELGERGVIPRAIVLDDVVAESSDPRFSLLLSRAAWDAIEVRSLPDDGRIEIDGEDSGLGPVGFFATVDYRAEVVSGRTNVRGVSLAPLGADGGEFDLELSATRAPSGNVDVAGRLVVREFVLAMPAVAPGGIGPIDADYEFAAHLQPDFAMGPRYQSPPGLLEFERGRLVVNGVAMDVLPSLRGFPVPGAIGLQVRLPDTPVGDIQRAVPGALLGELASMQLDGTFGWDLDLSVNPQAIGEMAWTADSVLEDFAVRAIPETMNPFRLNNSFVHVIADEAVGYRRAVRIPATRLPGLDWTLEHSEHTARQIARWRAGDEAIRAEVAANPPVEVPADGAGRPQRVPTPQTAPSPDPTYTYVRLEQMSPWVVRAVLTAEDGDFFFHDGVNFYTLPRALERNVVAGEIQFGASTISMQVVKMLFLDQQRLVSRKLQEAFLVYLMEQRVPVAKSRILEIYINIAEFGPGVFGIADAARYYFGKSADELGAGEATWLASILPSPKRYHQYYESGFISDGWFERMKSYFDIMLERGRMTEAEYEAAIRRPPRFELR